MCTKRHTFEPTHVFANLSSRVLTSSDENQCTSSSQRRCVEVSGTAETLILPDEFLLIVIIANKKESVDEAKASVARRLEYVEQTLCNHNVPGNEIEITKNLSRPGGRGWYHMEAEIDIVFHCLKKCMQLNNLFTEKLDDCVKILPVVLRNNKQQLEIKRKQTCLTALTNAQQKATEVCRLMGQSLGKPIYITENIVNETKGCESLDQLPANFNGLTGVVDLQKRVKENSISIRVDVTTTFEIVRTGKK